MKHYLPNDKPVNKTPQNKPSWFENSTSLFPTSPLAPRPQQQQGYKPPVPATDKYKPPYKPPFLSNSVSNGSSQGQNQSAQNNNANFISPDLNNYAILKMPEYEQFNFKAPQIKADEKDNSYQRSYDLLMGQKEKAEGSLSKAAEYQKLLMLTNRPFTQNETFNKAKPDFSFTPRRLETNGNQVSNNAYNKVGSFFSQTAKQMAEASETSRELQQNMMTEYGKNAKEVVDNATDFLTNKGPYLTLTLANKLPKFAVQLLTQSNLDFIKLTQQEVITNTKNYAYNSKAYENNLKNKTAGPEIYINGQGRDEYKDLKFGVKGTVGGNGCMGISIYNSLISLNDYESLPDINYKLSLTDGTLFGGELGGNPTYIKPYLMSKGYDVESHYLPNQETIENSVKNGDTAILFYGYSDPPGAHYITINYDASDIEKPYAIYNEFNSSLDANSYSDLSWYVQNKNYPIAVYTIRK